MVCTTPTPTPRSPSSSSASSIAWLERFRVGSLPTIYYVPDFVSASEEASLFQEVQGAPVAKWKTLKNRRLQNWGGIVHEKGLISQPIPPWLSSITEKITKETNLFPAPINHVLVNEYLPGQGITSHQDGPVYHPVVAILSLGAPTLMHFTPHTRLTETNKAEKSQCEEAQRIEDEKEHKVEATCSLVLMPGSLLVFKDSAYTDYLHGIDEAYEDFLDDKVMNLDAYLLHEKLVEDKSSKDFTRRETGAEHTAFQSQSNLGKGIRSEKDVLKRTGTRVSLTCRHVPKVYKNLLRL